MAAALQQRQAAAATWQGKGGWQPPCSSARQLQQRGRMTCPRIENEGGQPAAMQKCLRGTAATTNGAHAEHGSPTDSPSGLF